MSVAVVIGTVKGAWVLRSDEGRGDWRVEGPVFPGWKVTTSTPTPDGGWMLGTASDVYGAALHVSKDLAGWKQLERGPLYPQGGKKKLNQVWTVRPPRKAGERWWAGVDEAGLFSSEDGLAWEPVAALNDHPTREGWFPGFGGLCAHALLVDPQDARRVWCGISAVGVFRSDDGGRTWQPRNQGVPVTVEDKVHKGIGYCVHALAQDPDDPRRIWRQDHMGMYRTKDGGESWERIEEGLASRFGFPLAIDRRTKALFAAPLKSDEYRVPVDGKLRIYRSTDGGDSWHPAGKGLPEQAWTGVLRGALATDDLDPCGVYFGTTSGTVHVSNDRGESWRTLPLVLPRILHVAVGRA